MGHYLQISHIFRSNIVLKRKDECVIYTLLVGNNTSVLRISKFQVCVLTCFDSGTLIALNR